MKEELLGPRRKMGGVADTKRTAMATTTVGKVLWRAPGGMCFFCSFPLIMFFIIFCRTIFSSACLLELDLLIFDLYNFFPFSVSNKVTLLR
jgi:hypothetical protein